MSKICLVFSCNTRFWSISIVYFRLKNLWVIHVIYGCVKGLKWMGTHGNAVPRPPPFLQSGVPRPQRAFFHGNARSQDGNIVLSIINELVNPNLVNKTAWLEIQGEVARCKIERGPQIFTGAQGFPTTSNLHFNPWLRIRIFVSWLWVSR